MNGMIKPRKNKGLSLIELMIAILISAFLLAGIIQVFVGNSRTYSAIEEASRMQESGRYAIDYMSRVIRSAGYNGCGGSIGDITNTLNNANSSAYDFRVGINGFEATNSGPGTVVDIGAEYPPPAGGSGPWVGGGVPGDIAAVAIAGSDILVVRGAAGSGVGVAKNNNSSQLFSEDTGTQADACPDGSDRISTMCIGDIVMVSDCSKARVFQITNLTQCGGDSCVNVVHSQSGSSPGNAISSWGGASAPDAERFGPDSEIVRVQTTIFFIGQGTDGRPALFRRIGAANPEELVSGVENMQVLYGVNTDNGAQTDDGVADIYQTADQVADPAAIVSVHLSLLVRTERQISNTVGTSNYLLNGVAPAYATQVNPFDDRRGRYVFTSTVKLRNRGT
jgi:type IV pilus assembly protein PilW